MKIFWKILLGFVFFYLVLIFSVYFFHKSEIKIIESSDIIIHTHEVLESIDELLIQLLNMETGQRGYLLTQDINYLGPYNDSRTKILLIIDSIKELTLDNKQQQKNIVLMDSLVTEKMEELEASIYLNRTGSYEGSINLVLTNKGKETMDAIRALANTMHYEETILLASRSVLPEQALKENDRLFTIVLFFAAIIGALILYVTSNSIVKPIYFLIKRARKIGRGDFNETINIDNKSEVGKLANEFNIMAKNLSNFYTKLDKKVNLKTKELKISKDKLSRLNKSQGNEIHRISELLERLDFVVSGANLGVWDWWIKSGKVNFNKEWHSMLGYKEGEIKPSVKSWEKLVHPEDMPKVEKELQSHLKGKTKQYKAEHRLKTKSGKWFWILDIGKVIERDKNGEPIRAIGIHVDINERKIKDFKDKINIEKLRKMNSFMVNRENKMVELKKEIKNLKNNL